MALNVLTPERIEAEKEAQNPLHVVCNVPDLLDAVVSVASIVPSKTTKPYISNILFESHGGCLDVIGTDLEIAIRVRVEAVEVMNSGRLLLNGARVLKLLREFRKNRVDLLGDQHSGGILRSEIADCHVFGENPENYPKLPNFDVKCDVSTKSSQIIDLVKRTSFASGQERGQYLLCGILVDLDAKRLRMVATDGKRLALAEQRHKSPDVKPFSVVVPTKSLTILKSLLDDDEADVAINVDNRRIVLRTRRASLATRLIEGEYPPYEDTIPKNLGKVIEIEREILMDSLRLATLMTNKDSLAVKFCFSREQGLEITTRNKAVGKSKVFCKLNYPYKPLKVGFNPALLQDGLKNIKSQKIRIELQDSRTPAVIREIIETKDGPKIGRNFLYFIAPIAIL